ncbi:DUF1828 domain-containing protein [Neptuniibacter sp.]|uniref:DUF1828 domain-containing protein n=1 Tax=Neptuniibacter sp. TaxID=1962643 RepID=UPI00262FE6D6|nr:DUF1828 domain-containing protein [Neptuniibacter sp.]MCP4597510.1 DUF1828 domain-containing protein [Neptuniibacter sp.]
MNCCNFLQAIGFVYEKVDTISGSPALRVTLPISSHDGEPFKLLLISLPEGKVVISDDGGIIHLLSGEGISMSGHRRWSSLESLADSFDIELLQSGELKATYEHMDEVQYFFGDWLRFCSEVVKWQEERLLLDEGQVALVDEVELLLKAWKADLPIVKSFKVKGLSTQEHEFDFKLGDQLIDTISPNGRTTGSKLRKVLDIRSTNEDVDVMLIMDDRAQPEKAKYEIGILGSIVQVMKMSTLETSVQDSKTH